MYCKSITTERERGEGGGQKRVQLEEEISMIEVEKGRIDE